MLLTVVSLLPPCKTRTAPPHRVPASGHPQLITQSPRACIPPPAQTPAPPKRYPRPAKHRQDHMRRRRVTGNIRSAEDVLAFPLHPHHCRPSIPVDAPAGIKQLPPSALPLTCCQCAALPQTRTFLPPHLPWLVALLIQLPKAQPRLARGPCYPLYVLLSRRGPGALAVVTCACAGKKLWASARAYVHGMDVLAYSIHVSIEHCYHS